MKPWLKGGIVGIILLLVIAFADFTLGCDWGSNYGEGCGFLLVLATDDLGVHGWHSLWYIEYVVSSAFLYFLIGSFFGYFLFQRKEWGYAAIISLIVGFIMNGFLGYTIMFLGAVCGIVLATTEVLRKIKNKPVDGI